MTGDDLPDSDHIARYCSPRMVVDGLPLLEAFVPQPLDVPLSVVWVEHFGDIRSIRTFDDLRRSVGTHLSLRRNGRFAVLNIGRIRNAVATDSDQPVYIRHAPLDDFPSHAEISGFEHESPRLSRALQKLIGERDMHPALTDGPA